MAQTVRIAHFNDVYQLDDREEDPCGGAARFASKIKSLPDDVLVMFSGDAFAPSLLSTVFRGRHMLPVLNELRLAAACLGNHDLDHGLPQFDKLRKESNFPWLCSNCWETSTSRPLGGCLEKVVLTTTSGVKVGVMGLIEADWIATLATVKPEEVRYESFVERARTLARQLREEGADVVVATSHMRLPNDILLSDQVEEIDLVLGGHDHDSHRQPHKNGGWVVKSGTDFRELSLVTLSRPSASSRDWATEVEPIKISRDIEPDAGVAAHVAELRAGLAKKMDKVLGVLACDLDARFGEIRTKETNSANLVADIMRWAYRADLTILNSGSLRTDAIIPKGPFSLRDLTTLLPMMDLCCCVHVPGHRLLDALENGVSQHPKTEGRWPCVSGVSFEFDPAQPPGSRVDRSSVWVGGAPLDANRTYVVCTKTYLAEGKDGYDALREEAAAATEEGDERHLQEGSCLPNIVRNYFTMLKVANRMKGHDASAVEKAANRFLAATKGVCPDTGKIVIKPAVEGRIVEASRSDAGENGGDRSKRRRTASTARCV